jgi:hypothetical protein
MQQRGAALLLLLLLVVLAAAGHAHAQCTGYTSCFSCTYSCTRPHHRHRPDQCPVGVLDVAGAAAQLTGVGAGCVPVDGCMWCGAYASNSDLYGLCTPASSANVSCAQATGPSYPCALPRVPWPFFFWWLTRLTHRDVTVVGWPRQVQVLVRKRLPVPGPSLSGLVVVVGHWRRRHVAPLPHRVRHGHHLLLLATCVPRQRASADCAGPDTWRGPGRGAPAKDRGRRGGRPCRSLCTSLSRSALDVVVANDCSVGRRTLPRLALSRCWRPLSAACRMAVRPTPRPQRPGWSSAPLRRSPASSDAAAAAPSSQSPSVCLPLQVCARNAAQYIPRSPALYQACRPAHTCARHPFFLALSCAAPTYCCCASGRVLMMSESPGSVMESTPTRKNLPHAVPRSMLVPVYWCTPVLDSIA